MRKITTTFSKGTTLVGYFADLAQAEVQKEYIISNLKVLSKG